MDCVQHHWTSCCLEGVPSWQSLNASVSLRHVLQSGMNGLGAGMNGVNGGMNGLNAAALAIQALAATNPGLLMSQHPWLAGHMQMLAGLSPMSPSQSQHLQSLPQMPATGSMPIPPVDQLAAAQQLGQQLNGTGGGQSRLLTVHAAATDVCVTVPVSGRR